MESDPDALLGLAMEHRREGRLDEAEHLYRAVLTSRSNDPQALLGLGVIHLRRNDLDRALPLLESAARLEGGGDSARPMYARALVMAGQFERADSLLSERPQPPPEIELLLRQRWGFALMAESKAALAEIQLQRVVQLSPDIADAHADLAHAQLSQGKHLEAERTLMRALALDPGHADAMVNLGTALRALERVADAEAAYRRALSLKPGHAAAQRNLGALLTAGERHAEALALSEDWLARQRSVAAVMTRGAALQGLGRYDEAMACFSETAASVEDPYEPLTGVGLAQAALGQYRDALATLDRAVALRPAASLGRYRRAPVRLMTGDFEGGWRDYEARWQEEAFLLWSRGPAPRALKDRFNTQVTVEGLLDRRVLLVGEQGVGDQVMFASMIADLAGVAREVVCVCDERLIRLFSGSIPNVTFLPPAGTPFSLAGFDTILAMGSLGRLFRNGTDRFGGAAFLRAPPESLARWAARLGPARGRRIGLSWRGGTPGTRRAERSVALIDMAPLMAVEGTEFVSLQHGDPREEVRAVNEALGARVKVFDPHEIEDFEDLAGLIGNLDAVVSVQNTNVHLSGALGARCLALLPNVPEWRYMAEGTTMPWYQSVQLFRQAERGAWAPVMKAVADVLSAGGGR